MGDLVYALDEVLRKLSEKTHHEVLIHCVQMLILMPRFELIGLLEIFAEQVPADMSVRAEECMKKSKDWLMSGSNRNFYNLWKEGYIPDEVNAIYREEFNNDVYNLLNDYVDQDTISNDVVRKAKRYMKGWLNSGPVEIERVDKNFEDTYGNAYKAGVIKDINDNANSIFVSKKTFKQAEQDKKIEEKQELTRQGKRLEQMHEIMQKKFINDADEVVKKDEERFKKIFAAFDKNNRPVAEKDQTTIRNIWYGRYYNNSSVSDDILNIVEKFSINFKISNDQINSDTNRLILQTYIVSLYIGTDIPFIYTIINSVLKSYPSMSSHLISPDMIYENHVPNFKIQEVLNPVIKNIPLQNNQKVLRENWGKMRFPEIDISQLVEQLKSIHMNKAIRFKIVLGIEKLSADVVKKGLNIEKFAQEVHSVIQKNAVKIQLIKKEIVDLLRYK